MREYYIHFVIVNSPRPTLNLHQISNVSKPQGKGAMPLTYAGNNDEYLNRNKERRLWPTITEQSGA